MAALTTQCAQLDEANRAWQLYHQTQLDSFKDKLQNSLSIENSLSFDDIAQQILVHLDHMQNENENLAQQLETLEKLNHDLRTRKRILLILTIKLSLSFCSLEVTNNSQTMQDTYANTINELNQQLRLFKQQNDQLETEKYILNQQLEKLSTGSFNQERSTPSPRKTSIYIKQFIYDKYNVGSVSSDSELIKQRTQPTQIHEVCATSSISLIILFCYI